MTLLQQHLFYTNKDLKNYTLIYVGTSITIVTWKLTKNCSHMISNRPLSSCSSYYGSYQKFKHNNKTSSIPIKNIEVFYRLNRRLLFTSNITRPNIHDCVISLLTTMELPMNYYKNRNLKQICYSRRRYKYLYCHLQKTKTTISRHCFINTRIVF